VRNQRFKTLIFPLQAARQRVVAARDCLTATAPRFNQRQCAFVVIPKTSTRFYTIRHDTVD